MRGYRSACIEPLHLMVSVALAADAPITESAAEAAIIIRSTGKIKKQVRDSDGRIAVVYFVRFIRRVD